MIFMRLTSIAPAVAAPDEGSRPPRPAAAHRAAFHAAAAACVPSTLAPRRLPRTDHGAATPPGQCLGGTLRP